MISRLWKITLGGALASSSAALILSRIRTGSYGPGVNCTAHWLHGDDAAKIGRLDVSHSLAGIATNTSAVFFWAWFYDRALGRNPTVMRTLLLTAALGPVSCVVDYKATPKRFTPGWELVFSRSDMAVIYLSMVVGMLCGTLGKSSPCKKTEGDET